MHTLHIYPTEVKTLNSLEREFPGQIFIGRYLQDRCAVVDYYALLTFPMIALAPGEWIADAKLHMNCVGTCGAQRQINVCIGQSGACTPVRGRGVYAWDVAGALEGGVPVTLYAYAQVSGNCCALRRFGAFPSGRPPVLVITVGQEDDNIVDIIEEYTATDTISHTAWIENMSLKTSGFFVENRGIGTVRITTEVSPDGILSASDAGPILIEGGQTNYIAPLRASRFVRAAFLSVGGTPEPILIWFQGTR